MPCPNNLDVLSPRIDAEKMMDDTFKDTMTRGLQRLTDVFGHQVYLSLILKAYCNHPLKLQWSV